MRDWGDSSETVQKSAIETIADLTQVNTLTEQLSKMTPTAQNMDKYLSLMERQNNANIEFFKNATAYANNPLNFKTTETFVDPGNTDSKSGNSTGITPAPILPPVNPIPNLPIPNIPITPVVPIKTARPDIILYNDDQVDTDILADLLFEDIGGQELLSITRHDTVNGQETSYQIIKNLQLLQQEYNTNSLLKIQQTSDKVFANFPIKLQDKIPNVGSGPAGEYVYFSSNGDLILEFINLDLSEEIEIQIASNGTIYEAGI